ncbi:MAG: nucleoside-triphosphatase [Desulfurococcales archaeon]|nr:nucleoside-triphosphatase [Desulfurococcales archaeon]
MIARIGLTGPPGSGKTTIVKKAVSLLTSRGCEVTGFYTPEVRVGGQRLGFQIEDIETGRKVWLAKRNIGSRFRVGSYGVLMEAGAFMHEILARSLDSDFIVIDEIGPMELVFSSVEMEMKRILAIAERFLVVYHRRLRNSHPEIFNLIKSKGKTFWIDKDNRDNTWKTVETELISVCK